MDKRIKISTKITSNGGHTDHPQQALFVIDNDKTIADCNITAEKLFRIKAKQIIGLPFNEFIRSKAKPIGISRLINCINRNIPDTLNDIELKGRKGKFRFSVITQLPVEGWLTISAQRIDKETEPIKEAIEVDMMYLANLASKFSEITDEDEIFEFLASILRDLYPGMIILINRTSPDAKSLVLEKVLGIETSLFYKLIKVAGFNPIGKHYPISQEFIKDLARPKIHNYGNSLYKFSNNEVPETIANIIEKAIKLKTIYTIGIADQGQFFGFIHFFATTGSEDINKSVIESVVYLCYLSVARIRTLKYLEESQRQYKLLADNARDVIFTLDLNLNYTYISPSVKNLRGYLPSEIIGKPISNSLSPASFKFIQHLIHEKLEEFKKETVSPTEELLIEVELPHRDGSMVWTEIKASFILNTQKKPIGILGVTRNIAERKIAEKELQQKNNELHEINAQKDKLFSIIAHDLKNPFGHILNFSGLLMDHYDQYSDSRRKQFIDLINKSSRQIYLLLENLLDWARSQSGKMDFFPLRLNLEKVIFDVVNLLSYPANSKNIRLNVLVPQEATLFADEFMLKTVLRNLLGNAIKFTPDGGEVTIEASYDRCETVISVTDNGLGMDENLKNSLFSLDLSVTQPGTQGEKGTGLGLLLCKEFVERHGGRIWVTSKLGKGTIFRFSIPENSKDKL